MQSVILAAGRNKRIWELVKPFHKPLIPLNGRPLVVNLTENLAQLTSRVVVVVAPENAVRIRDELRAAAALTPEVRIVVQPFPRGPGDALLRGMEATDDGRIMVVCGDNVIPADELERFVAYSEDSPFVVGAAIKHENDAGRFTRCSPDGRKFSEGPLHDSPWDDGLYRVWLGPLLVPSAFKYTLAQASKNAGSQDVLIGPHLNTVVGYVGEASVMLTEGVVDVGTMEDLRRVIS